MKNKRRWMIWVQKESANPGLALPWVRRRRETRAA